MQAKHIKLTKSNSSVVHKPKLGKTIRKVLSNCSTPRTIISKLTSRNASPCSTSSKSIKKLTGKLPKTKRPSSKRHKKIVALRSFFTSSKPSIKNKIAIKTNKLKILSNNLTPTSYNKPESTINSLLKESIQSHEKSCKNKTQPPAYPHLKQTLHKILKENTLLKTELLKLIDNQEEPKSSINSFCIETVMENIKDKLQSLKEKFL